VLYVLQDGKRPRERRGKIELIPVTLADFRSPPAWFKPATAHARVVLDKTGELAGVVEQARSITREEVGEGYDAYGLEGRRAPYSNAWTGTLGELEPLIFEVARTADPQRQQELQARVAELADANGFRDVREAWKGEIEHAMGFRFD
jgi:hypothetical protein